MSDSPWVLITHLVISLTKNVTDVLTLSVIHFPLDLCNHFCPSLWNSARSQINTTKSSLGYHSFHFYSGTGENDQLSYHNTQKVPSLLIPLLSLVSLIYPHPSLVLCFTYLTQKTRVVHGLSQRKGDFEVNQTVAISLESTFPLDRAAWYSLKESIVAITGTEQLELGAVRIMISKKIFMPFPVIIVAATKSQ